jgi:ketosteroid isomerase-like protein
MAEQDNVQTIKEAYAAFERGDLPSILNLLSEDVQWYVPGPESIVPFAGQFQGVGGVSRFFVTLAEAETVEIFEPQEFVAQGDKVVVTGRYRGRIKANGQADDIEFVHIFTVRDGRITNYKQYNDTASTVAAYSGATAATA